MHLAHPSHDKSRELLLGRREGVQAYHFNVDNFGVTAKTQQAADAALNEWRELFAERGLILHKSKLGQKVESLGTDLDGVSLCCRVSSKRFWTLRRALDEVLRRRTMTGRALEIILGHITFVLRGARPAFLYTAHVLSFRQWRLASGMKPGPKLWQFVDFESWPKLIGRGPGTQESFPRTAAFLAGR